MLFTFSCSALCDYARDSCQRLLPLIHICVLLQKLAPFSCTAYDDQLGTETALNIKELIGGAHHIDFTDCPETPETNIFDSPIGSPALL